MRGVGPCPRGVEFKAVEMTNFQSWEFEIQEKESHLGEGTLPGSHSQIVGLTAGQRDMQNLGKAEAPPWAGCTGP